MSAGADAARALGLEHPVLCADFAAAGGGSRRGRAAQSPARQICMAVGSESSGAVCACRACRVRRSGSAAPSAGRCRTLSLCCPLTRAIRRLTVLLQHHGAPQIACCLHASFQTVCCRQCVAKKF
jgi:hypothetical protein